MRKFLLTFTIISALAIISTSNSYGNIAPTHLKSISTDSVAVAAALCDTTTVDEEEEVEEEVAGETKEEAKARKKKERAAKRVVTLQSILENLQKPKMSGDENLDKFYLATMSMLLTYKEMNDFINFIKIETFEIEDSGDGVTTAVRITDGDGNELNTGATIEKFVGITVNLAGFALSIKAAIDSCQAYIQSISNDPSKALFLLTGMRNIRDSIRALNLLSAEVPITIKKANEQISLLKQYKRN